MRHVLCLIASPNQATMQIISPFIVLLRCSAVQAAEPVAEATGSAAQGVAFLTSLDTSPWPSRALPPASQPGCRTLERRRRRRRPRRRRRRMLLQPLLQSIPLPMGLQEPPARPPRPQRSARTAASRRSSRRCRRLTPAPLNALHGRCATWQSPERPCASILLPLGASAPS